MKQFSILLIEDDDVDVMNIKRAMKSCNLTNAIYRAKDGIEGLELLSIIENPIIVLLDLNMPRMNGIEFLQAVRADDDIKKSVVVVLTTSNEEKDKIKAFNLNVAGYIVKPVKFEDFVTAMASLGKYWTISELPEEK
jgi:CheY-like chemotaxis protein